MTITTKKVPRRPVTSPQKAATVFGWAWDRRAPRGLVAAQRFGKPGHEWRLWQRHLARRRRSIDPWRPFPRDSVPLLWAVPEQLEDRQAGLAAAGDANLIRLLCDAARGDCKAAGEAVEQLPAWLAESAAAAATAGYGLECLAWCYALPQLAQYASSPIWWQLLEQLFESAVDGGGLDLAAQPWEAQLLGGELPLALGCLLPEIQNCRRLKTPARLLLGRSLEELLDGEGLPHANHLALLRPLLACWTRCRALGRNLRKGCFDRRARSEFHWLVVAALRLMRADGGQMLAPSPAVAPCGELFRVAAELDESRSLGELVAAGLSRRGRGRRPGKRLPRPGSSSEWSGVATLRSNWTRRATILAATFNGQSRRVELVCGGSPLLSGDWTAEVRCDGRVVPAPAAAQWEEVCWVTNRRAQYLELELALGEGLRLQRSMLLAVNDEFLLLADTITGPQGQQIDYAGKLPLADGVDVEVDSQSRELVLNNGKKMAARVLPLSLPEWRSDPRLGELVVSERQLMLSQSGPGGSLYAPLFLDLSPRRRNKPLTWRRLTVAEDRRAVRGDVAVGYRVQIGGRQWLFYRAVSRLGNRTVLGQNLSTEFKAGRFDRQGDVKTLMEIE